MTDYHAFDEYLILILTPDGVYDHYRRPARTPEPSKGAKVRSAKSDEAGVISHRGHRYQLEYSKAHALETWYPWRPYNWYLSIFLDRAVPKLRRIGLLIFLEPTDPLHGVEVPIKPLDRLTDLSHYEDANGVLHDTGDYAYVLSPSTVRTFATSKVYKMAIRRTPFGLGVSTRTWMVILAVMFILIVILYQGGYFE